LENTSLPPQLDARPPAKPGNLAWEAVRLGARASLPGRQQHSGEILRAATIDDSGQLLRLWDLLFDKADAAAHRPWEGHAQAWFERTVSDSRSAHFPVVETDGAVA